MKKIIVLLLTLTMLAGCSTTVEEPNTKSEEPAAEITEQEEAPVEEAIDEQDTIESEESDIGTLTVVKKNKEINEVRESGPFTIKVNKLQVAHLEVAEDYKYMFDDKETTTVVTMEVEVENNSTDTNTIYPDQGTIVTNTKEQIEAAIFLSDSLGGDYIGEVIKKGNVIFLLDSPAEEITNIKYIISSPINADWDSVGEEIVFELEI